ncbi:hypothetical protein [Pseudanabaena sp. UWO310]|uniref:hypothetical protein n=1 Tax=Pseudanabaena sp. UWO310 TaxID=2480795 RepID=UPI001158F293|nr:hypothetical protein [Pseudanabaena sp. UWO310]TYQ31913.1 hypothetical protein PseudUWO310_00015 [Pseudanabaena sp. UWO310]
MGLLYSNSILKEKFSWQLMADRISRSGTIAMTFSGFLRCFKLFVLYLSGYRHNPQEEEGDTQCRPLLLAGYKLQKMMGFFFPLEAGLRIEYNKKQKTFAKGIDKPLVNLHNKERLNKETKKTSCKPASKSDSWFT